MGEPCLESNGQQVNAVIHRPCHPCREACQRNQNDQERRHVKASDRTTTRELRRSGLRKNLHGLQEFVTFGPEGHTNPRQPNHYHHHYRAASINERRTKEVFSEFGGRAEMVSNRGSAKGWPKQNFDEFKKMFFSCQLLCHYSSCRGLLNIESQVYHPTSLA